MDLRVFIRDLEGVLSDFLKRYPGSTLNQVVVTGEGSAHPDLPALLQDHLNCSVKQVRPLLTNGLREWDLDEPMLQSSLSRLVGLGLGLLGPEQAIEPPDAASAFQVGAQNSLASDSIVSESGGSDFAALPSSSSLVDSSPGHLAVDEDVPSTLTEAELLEAETGNDESEWPSLNLDANKGVLEEVVEVDVEVEIEPAKADLSEAEIGNDESEWPSLNLDANKGVLEETVEVGVEGEIEPVKVEGSEGEMQDDESEWPSLNLDAHQNSTSSTSSADQSVSENSVIPGLPMAKNQQGQSNVISQSDSIGDLADSDVDQSPLGELRFKD